MAISLALLHETREMLARVALGNPGATQSAFLLWEKAIEHCTYRRWPPELFYAWAGGDEDAALLRARVRAEEIHAITQEALRAGRTIQQASRLASNPNAAAIWMRTLPDVQARRRTRQAAELEAALIAEELARQEAQDRAEAAVAAQARHWRRRSGTSGSGTGAIARRCRSGWPPRQLSVHVSRLSGMRWLPEDGRSGRRRRSRSQRGAWIGQLSRAVDDGSRTGCAGDAARRRDV